MSRDSFPLTLQVRHHHHLRLGEPLRQVEEVQGAVKAEEANLGAGITRQAVQLLGQRLCEKTQVACNTAKAVVMFCNVSPSPFFDLEEEEEERKKEKAHTLRVARKLFFFWSQICELLQMP